MTSKFKLTFSAIVVGTMVFFASQSDGQELKNGLGNLSYQNGSSIHLKLCFVMLIDDIDVPALQSGFLESVNFRENDYVKLNQQVAKVDDQTSKRQLAESQARHKIAEQKAADNVEIEFAEISYEFAYNQYDREKQLLGRGAGKQTDLDHWRHEAKKALKSKERAKADKALAQLETLREGVLVKNATDLVERHIIRSKIDGNVFEIYKKAGEWVTAGDSVLRVVRMNRLRVQGFIDAGKFDRHEIANQKVTVSGTFANGRVKKFKGKVSYIALDEHAGNRFMIWADVENQSEKGQWLLVPNDEVTMEIHLGTAGAAAPKVELKADPVGFKVPPQDNKSEATKKTSSKK